MTFAEARLSLQIIAEVEIGAPRAAAAAAAKAIEDAKFAAVTKP